MTVQEKLDKIKAQRAQSKVERELAMLDKEEYVDFVLAKEDAKVLDAILADISEAYDQPIYIGFTYAENVEKLVAICNKLQYAKADVRELINADYYSIFDRSIRDKVIKAYGQLPYSRELTTVELNDGTSVVLDQDIVQNAKKGKPANVACLQLAIDILSNVLNLQANYKVSQAEADVAWANAKAKIDKVERLKMVASDYEQSL